MDARKHDPATCGLPHRQHTAWGVRVTCVRCGAYAWGDGRPLVARAVHEARKRAHAALDPLWKNGPVSRSAVYAELARRMGLPPARCHIAQMDEAACADVEHHAATMAREWVG